MLYNIRGRLTLTDVNFIVVECGGIGFKCFTTLNTVKEVGSVGSEVNIYTYLSVREDAMDLFGFATAAELDAFKLLISVSGVGPKAAAAILSELTPDRLAVCIAAGDVRAITRAQGVGKKTAERIVLELKDKMGSIAVSDDAYDAVNSVQSLGESSNTSEAVEALVALGYSQSDAAVAVGAMDKTLSVDEMIRQGLKQLAKKL